MCGDSSSVGVRDPAGASQWFSFSMDSGFRFGMDSGFRSGMDSGSHRRLSHARLVVIDLDSRLYNKEVERRRNQRTRSSWRADSPPYIVGGSRLTHLRSSPFSGSIQPGPPYSSTFTGLDRLSPPSTASYRLPSPSPPRAPVAMAPDNWLPLPSATLRACGP